MSIVLDIIDPNNLIPDFNKQEKSLVAEGFSPEEAEHLAWLQNHRVRGKYYGLATGLFTIVTCRKTIRQLCQTNLPRAVYQPWAKYALNAGIIYASVLAFDYLYTSNRFAANNKFTNHTMLSNRLYQDSREAFIQNFEPLNRKFTAKEAEQFTERDGLITVKKGERNWIYNPYVHGDDEQAWKDQINFLYERKQRASEHPLVQQQIREQNQAKINNGEEIEYKPFNTLDYIDQTGEKHGLARFFAFNRWQPIM